MSESVVFWYTNCQDDGNGEKIKKNLRWKEGNVVFMGESKRKHSQYAPLQCERFICKKDFE